MRVLPISVTAVAAALLLTACGSGDGDPSGSGSASGSASGGGKNGDTAACRISDVGLEVGPVSAAPAAGDTGTVTVTLTGRGTDCTLDGFPQVTLAAAGTDAEVPADKAAQGQQLTLAKDTTASFTITYVRGGAGASLPVDKLTVSLPGASDAQSFPWTYGPVVSGSKGVPDASVSAFQQAGD
ncbi:DUF4232 domain-containing protein [Streptomyces griseosporeus]|uniref:DUF4232 domain-containing protein n=1 Tax=Streptomyces griseosporeus TaxID=1910 RepID=UPI00167D236A|nr:DUF4232 domain-containing protein [Streptomyces griseosporeus]GHF76294.1 hypothetical protein GCM10018783_53100 [Streptomyces griseosporeus]